MKVYRFLEDLPPFRHPVLTIGTFDGVHAGHQQIIQRIRHLAEEVGGETVVLTFHPHPRLVLNPADDSLQLLHTLPEKIRWLEQYGVDHLVIATFSPAFAQTPPREYIRDFLVEKIHPAVLVIGYDHRFGKNRSGDIDTMRQYATEFNYRVEEIEKHLVEDITVSSTRIRQALQDGKIAFASQLLGHPFTLTGQVIKGHQIGQQIGYPTANLFIEDRHKLIPATGIYAARVEVDGSTWDAMLYIGNRPTFAGTEKAIEVNLIDFSGNLYGKELCVQLIAEVRSDRKFDSPEALTAQIAADKEAVLQILRGS